MIYDRNRSPYIQELLKWAERVMDMPALELGRKSYGHAPKTSWWKRYRIEKERRLGRDGGGVRVGDLSSGIRTNVYAPQLFAGKILLHKATEVTSSVNFATNMSVLPIPSAQLPCILFTRRLCKCWSS